jgi:hypothetical protein
MSVIVLIYGDLANQKSPTVGDRRYLINELTTT